MPDIRKPVDTGPMAEQFETTTCIQKGKPSWMPKDTPIYRDEGKGRLCIELSDGDFAVMTIDPTRLAVEPKIKPPAETSWAVRDPEELQRLRALVSGI